jgi:hypothetical protein
MGASATSKGCSARSLTGSGELDAAGRLLANPAELTRLIGDVKSELFHYEVRATYDTPEVADSRRIINEAIKQAEQGSPWQSTSGKEDGDDAPEW